MGSLRPEARNDPVKFRLVNKLVYGKVEGGNAEGVLAGLVRLC